MCPRFFSPAFAFRRRYRSVFFAFSRETASVLRHRQLIARTEPVLSPFIFPAEAFFRQRNRLPGRRVHLSSERKTVHRGLIVPLCPTPGSSAPPPVLASQPKISSMLGAFSSVSLESLCDTQNLRLFPEVSSPSKPNFRSSPVQTVKPDKVFPPSPHNKLARRHGHDIPSFEVVAPSRAACALFISPSLSLGPPDCGTDPAEAVPVRKPPLPFCLSAQELPER